MTQQSGRSDYGRDARTRDDGMADRVAERATATAERAREIGGEALDRADQWLRPVGLSIKDRPVTCLAIVGGLAFAAGAFWMLRNSRQQSQINELLGQLADRLRWR
jgi:hypothetical protein